MRFFLLSLCYGVIALALMTTWLVFPSFPLLRIDLLLPAVSVITFTKEWKTAVPLLAIFGSLVDATSFAPFGMTIASYIGSYLLMRLIISKVSFQMGLGRLFWVGFMSLIQKCISVMLMFLWTNNPHLFKSWVPFLLLQVLLDAAAGFVFVPVMMWYGDLTFEEIFRPKGLVME